MNFLGGFQSIKFFDEASMGQKGNLVVLKVAVSPKPEKPLPTKIGVHACYINPYLHEFFEPIPID